MAIDKFEAPTDGDHTATREGGQFYDELQLVRARRGGVWFCVEPSTPGFVWIVTSWQTQGTADKLAAVGLRRDDTGGCSVKCRRVNVAVKLRTVVDVLFAGTPAVRL